MHNVGVGGFWLPSMLGKLNCTDIVTITEQDML